MTRPIKARKLILAGLAALAVNKITKKDRLNIYIDEMTCIACADSTNVNIFTDQVRSVDQSSKASDCHHDRDTRSDRKVAK